ncbi:hypothetical protein M409DRAFT_27275 [Zasmidium cellare ATCC 36951]|uniref:Uncharacterized protein n=1 Tax=Zasmidium cellare ATCC 36951 TaxID=1080233 RepID=A0A6A6C8P6_ZASCE|nr:uncharacterized protein M409DRAFT_27275 [Zasmidium cellare ATCC 36951]KAF2162272.1 hypothetical protein M409DRAFT_27275 [Zasmidium cellare ATCC 36951]
MATPFLCANDTPFEHLNHARALSTQYAGIEDLLDEDLCNERLLQLNRLQPREENSIAWENPACSLQYGFVPSEWSPTTHETYASPHDQEESAFSDCSFDTFNSESSYTWGPAQSEEPEPQSTNLPRLSCRKCYRKFENAYSLEQHAKKGFVDTAQEIAQFGAQELSPASLWVAGSVKHVEAFAADPGSEQVLVCVLEWFRHSVIKWGNARHS